MRLFQRALIALSFLIVATHSNAQLAALDGNWYSTQWKYGYVLKDGLGVATSTNSPNFQVGQNILQLTATSPNTFTGQQVYTDGKFYRVNATLQADGRLYFEGEKNAKWVMTRVGAPPPASTPTNQATQTNANAPSQISHSPSFDCSKASNPYEKAVCANPALSSLDNQLASAYKNARAKSLDPEALRKTQVDWIKSTRQCASNTSCIEKAYKDRIAALGARVQSQPLAQVPQKNEISQQSSLQYIGGIESGDFFVDKASIKRNGDWVSYTYITDYLPKINFQDQDVLSQVALNKINCSSKQLMMGNYNLYSEKKGAGKLIASAQLGVNAPSIPVQTIDNPNSVNAAVFNYVCQGSASAPVALNNPPRAPAQQTPATNTTIAQKIKMAGDAIGGPRGWGECMAAHLILDISASKPGALLPRLAEANQALGIMLGEIRQMYLRNGVPDATLGQFLKANTGRFTNGDQALDMVVKCNNKMSEVVG